jgi:3-oxoacyl-(acyl-carrier-protein) synthase
MSLSEACVVGFGMIDALGDNPVDCWNNLISDEDFHQPIDQFMHGDHGLKITTGFYPRGLNIDEEVTPRTVHYGLHAAEQAIQMANLPHSSNVGVIFSSLTGGNASRSLVNADGRKLKPKLLLKGGPDHLCSQISLMYGYNGINTCINSACATGLVSIEWAMRMLDEYDYIIVGGADAGINANDLRFFSMIKAIGNRSTPFDKNRNGFVMGDGAGCIILQSPAKAKEMGSKVYARITGAASGSDAFNATAPSGTGARVCLSKLDLEGVDSVNAHGTSTPIGDQVEYDVVREFTNAPIYSNKGKIGHTFAAAGVLETIYSILSIQNGCIPHNAGCKETDLDINLENVYTDVKKVLVNSFGFGGKCCSLIVEKFNGME